MAISNDNPNRTAGQKLRALFAEREIFLRSHGKVRFVKITSRAQMIAAGAIMCALLVWAAITLAMAWNQWTVAGDRAALEATARSVSAQVSKVDAYRRSVGDVAADLDRRQDALDDIVRSQFGDAALKNSVVADDAKAKTPSVPAGDKISAADPASAPTRAAVPGADTLKKLADRQTRFARQLASLIDQRSAKAEAAIRSFGLNPQVIAGRAAASAQGGPYIPWASNGDEGDHAFSALASSFARLNALERGLVAIPSGRPTATPMLTSSYGYRRDPFNGRPAFHAGLDFPGSYGQPIIAAANGRVSYVGQQSGYGNVVEIDHGNGIMTRYAHLSRFAARVGQSVVKGDPVGRMGSTGRSTGTHLHFEVRVNGEAINPRRFLEAKQDVLQVQQSAKQRVAQVLRGRA